MRKMIFYIILALLVIVLGSVCISYLFNPLRKSEASIRTDILEITPIGMNIDDALNVIENENWTNVGINYSRGVSRVEIQQLNENVGTKSIKARLGRYTTFFETQVIAWWAFDENLKLVDVFVRKDIHGF